MPQRGFLPLQWLKNITIRIKLIVGFGIVVLLVVLMGLAGFTALQETHKLYIISQELIHFRLFQANAQRIFKDIVTAHDLEELQALEEELEENEEAEHALKKMIEAHFPSRSSEFTHTFEEMEELEEEFGTLIITRQKEKLKNTASLSASALDDFTVATLLPGTPPLDKEKEYQVVTLLEIMQLFTDIQPYNTSLQDIVREEVMQANTKASLTLLIMILVTATLAIGIGGLIARSISLPIIAMRDAAIEISEGNFVKRIAVTSRDEIGQLAQAFNAMTRKLKSLYDSLETTVKERTQKLQENVKELERINAVMIGRELRIKELKEKNALLRAQCKKKPPPH